MGHTVRTVLSRLSPVLWAAVIGLVTWQAICPWLLLRLGGVIVATAALGIAGTVCGAIEATHDSCVQALLDALVKSRPMVPGPRRRQRHRAAA